MAGKSQTAQLHGDSFLYHIALNERCLLGFGQTLNRQGGENLYGADETSLPRRDMERPTKPGGEQEEISQRRANEMF